MTQALHIEHGLRNVARALRRRRRLRLTLRALWLALAVWSAGLLAGLFGLTVPVPLLLACSGVTLLVGIGYALLSNPSLAALARGLDFHYDLAEQLATADEVARRGPRTAVEQRLLEDTDDLLLQMQRYFRSQPLIAWREVETAVAVLLLAAGLTVATRPLLPAAQSPVALPELPVPTAPTETAREQPTEQPVEQQQEQELSPEAQQAAEAIADALRDNGATRPAADALDGGDTGTAARELRELADQADQLSEGARSDLADSLRGAAEQLEGTQPALADDLRQQADGIQQGGQQAAEALDDLARTVEQLGQDPGQAAEASPGGEQQGQEQGQGQEQQGQGDGGEQGNAPGEGAGNGLGGEERGAQGDGAQAEGDTLPLPQASDAGGPTTEATGPKGPAIQLEAGGTGDSENSGANQGDSPLEGEADPNAIPAEYRDVVEEYFTPEP